MDEEASFLLLTPWGVRHSYGHFARLFGICGFKDYLISITENESKYSDQDVKMHGLILKRMP